MSNQKIERVQLKLNVPLSVKDRLQKASHETGYSMVKIITFLVENNLTTLDLNHDIRRALAKVAKNNTSDLKLTAKQKKAIAHATGEELTKHLI